MMANKTAGPGGPLRPTRETKISELLRAYPDMIEVLARYNKHFELLRRPTLRKLMTPLVTIEKAARTAQVDPNEMLAEIYRSIGEPLPPDLGGSSPAPQSAGTPMPEELRRLPEERRVILDVREQVRAGEEPYHWIMKTVASLRADQVLQLCNIFEPVPLYDVLAQRGFAHWTERRGPQEWWITFYPAATPAERSSAPSAASSPQAPSPNPLVVDARGLEPPQPMAKILETLPRIAGGGQILALTDRRPMLLYPKLEERGFAYSTEEMAHGWFETRIWK
ncbi:MAG: DUF2249 domain-containing protein [candidate division NC10 bacterium]|nr:DUF2249 domain-containing protein [candidate division NC10 bacterium]